MANHASRRYLWIGLCLLLFPIMAYAGTKISEMTATTALESNDLFVVVDTSDNETKKITLANLLATLGSFGDTIMVQSTTGQSVTVNLYADAGEDNSDKWRLSAADGGNITLETYVSGAWVAVATWTNAGAYTVTGALAGTTLNTGQGAYELYAMNQDLESTDSVSFATITEGVNAVPNATDPLSFFAATTSAQLAGVLSDETGMLKSVFSDSPEFTTKITTPAITAPGASLVIKPTTDAVNAVQVQDKDGNNILNVDAVNNRVGIGTATPIATLHVDGDIALGIGSVVENKKIGLMGVDWITGSTNISFLGATDGAGISGSLHFLTTHYGVSSGEKMVIDKDGSIGIGTTAPDTLLELSKAAADTEVTISTYHDTEATSPTVTLRKADGLEATPGAVDDNAVLGTYKFKGYDGDSWANGAYIQARVDGTPADGSMPTEVAIATSVDGSESPTEKLSAGPNTVNILSGLTLKKTNVSDANYGTSALTSDYIVAFTSLTAARTATISTEDEDSGTATQPRVMIFKDESGSAATYNITISLESGGTIDGAANFVIDQPYQSVTIYLNGTSGFVM